VPCDSTIIIGIELGKVNPVAMGEALKDLGFTGTVAAFTGVFEGVYFRATIDAATGKLSVSARGYIDEDRLKAALLRANSKAIVARQAKLKGWTMKQLPGNKYVLNKR
jgi:hypothetical protein